MRHGGLPEWGQGGTADVAVRAADGRTVLTSTIPIAADGGFAVAVPEAGGLAPGDYSIRVRAKGGAGATIDETARVTVAAEAPVIGDAIVWRRRPATGPAYFRTADPRASRTDRLRFELPARRRRRRQRRCSIARESDVRAAAGEHARRRRAALDRGGRDDRAARAERLRGGSEGWRRDAHHRLPRRFRSRGRFRRPSVLFGRSAESITTTSVGAVAACSRSPSCSRTAVKISGGASAGRPGVLSGDQRRSMR
jgi:hypothetical protein